MAKRRNFFDDQSVGRIARVVRQVEGTPRSTPGPSTGRSLSSDPELWQECKNAAGETIPGHSVVFIDTTAPTMDDRKVGNAIKPSTTFYGLHGFTMDRDAELIDGVGKVSVTMETGLVKYDTGTPAPGEGWGIKPGQYTLSKGYPGARCIRIVDSTKKIMLAQFLPITVLYGKATAAISANSVATGSKYDIYAGTLGSEADAGFTTVPDAFNRGAAIANNDPVWLELGPSGWFIGKIC